MERTPEERAANIRQFRRIVENDTDWDREFARQERSVLFRGGFNSTEIDDILQDTRIDAWRNLEASKYNGDSKPAYYLHRITQFKSADVIDVKKRPVNNAISLDDPIRQNDPDSGSVIDTIPDPAAANDGTGVEIDDKAKEYCKGMVEIHKRIDTLKNEKHSLILHCLLYQPWRERHEGNIYAGIEETAMSSERGYPLEKIPHGMDFPRNQVPANIERAKPLGEKIINAVADERKLEEKFRCAAMTMLQIRNAVSKRLPFRKGK